MEEPSLATQGRRGTAGQVAGGGQAVVMERDLSGSGSNYLPAPHCSCSRMGVKGAFIKLKIQLYNQKVTK